MFLPYINKSYFYEVFNGINKLFYIGSPRNRKYFRRLSVYMGPAKYRWWPTNTLSGLTRNTWTREDSCPFMCFVIGRTIVVFTGMVKKTGIFFQKLKHYSKKSEHSYPVWYFTISWSVLVSTTFNLKPKILRRLVH